MRKATSTLYKPTPDMFAGDEDNGEMGAWYILSTLGLYGLNPGTEDYVLGSPMFARVEIDLSEGIDKQHNAGLRGILKFAELTLELTLFHSNQSDNNFDL